jgi:serine/threonine protein kinase
MIVGTPEYMSPEQPETAMFVDYRTAPYSLGILAYEMLCGQPPFTAARASAACRF